jgi:hypothetical protein
LEGWIFLAARAIRYDGLIESGALERERNYANKAAYVASKERFLLCVPIPSVHCLP